MLGPLELRVMEVLWERGDSTVRDVMPHMEARAYTTVMTTVERLYRKGLLERPLKRRRGFVYRPKVTKEMWEQTAMGAYLASCHPRSLGVLASSLVDAMGEGHESLLDELERKIRAKREELQAGRPD